MNNWQSSIAHNCKKIENFTIFIIDKLENQKIGLTAWLISFFCRYFFEKFFGNHFKPSQFAFLGLPFFSLSGLLFLLHSDPDFICLFFDQRKNRKNQ